MNGHGAYDRHETRHHNQSRHHDVVPRPRHGERPLPRRPTGPQYDVRPPAPLPTPVRQTSRRPTTRYSRRDRNRDRDPFDDPTCMSEGISDDDVPLWSWKSMVASVTSMTLFASVFGLIGIMFAALAYSDHKVGDYRRAKFKTRLAWFFALFGMTVTLFAIVFLCVVMFALNVPKPTFMDRTYWVPPWLYNNLENP